MDVFRVIFIGRKRGAIGAFSRWQGNVASQSIARTHIIAALGDQFEINAIILRENLTQGDLSSRAEPSEPVEISA